MSDRGATVVELLVVSLVVAGLAALSAPVTASVIDASRVRHAASFLSARFRLARQQAVGLGANVGVVFDQTNGHWQVRVCRDGSGNGLRRADIQSGVDPCIDGPHDIAELFSAVDVAVDAALRGPGGEAGSPESRPLRLRQHRVVLPDGLVHGRLALPALARGCAVRGSRRWGHRTDPRPLVRAGVVRLEGPLMAVRVFLGRDAEVVRETKNGLLLDGRIRLRPGFVIDVVPVAGGRAWPGGPAFVWSWRIRSVGSRGPIFRGECRWHRPSGNGLPAPDAHA